ncbi:MAG TPA: PAS domain-containing protein [Oscillatoriaceae cyanobacterium]
MLRDVLTGAFVVAGGLAIAGAWGIEALTRRLRPESTVSRKGAGAPAGGVNACFDSTDRKRVEQEHRQFELLVRSVVDYAIFMLDPQGRIVTWNKGAEALKGYSESEIIGRPLSVFYTPEDLAAGRLQRFMQEAAQKGSAEDQGWRIRKDGSRFWADAVLTAMRDESGRLVGYAKVTRDLTERKRAEERLVESTRILAQQQRLLAGIVEHVPAAIAYVDGDLIYRWNNPAHCTQMGLPREAIIGHTVFEVMPGTESALRPRYERVLRSGEPQFETALPLVFERNGRRHETYWDTAYVPVTENGCVTGILLLGIEVSERIAREKSQQAMIEKLRAIDRMKDEFLSVLSHELRTPINAIMGFGSILDDEIAGPLNARQHDYLGKILNGSDVLLALVSDLLDMSRIQANKLVLDCHALDFGAATQKILDGMAPLAEHKHQRLVSRVPSALPHVIGDAQRLGQVLTNLIGNAIKFTPDGGVITVQACAVEGAVRCEVHDTGVGIAAEDIPRLFQRFTQLDSSSTRAAGGTGLGLSICRALVEAMGGEIGVESKPGEGSTFWFTLPRADEV